MIKLRIMALVLALIGLCSMAANAAPRDYINLLNAWIGEDIEHLVDQWGAPAKQEALSNGNYEVFYQASNPYYHEATPDTYVRHCQGGGCGGWQIQSYGHDAYYSYTQCYTAFEVNNGMIVKWRWKGDCKL